MKKIIEQVLFLWKIYGLLNFINLNIKINDETDIKY